MVSSLPRSTSLVLVSLALTLAFTTPRIRVAGGRPARSPLYSDAAGEDTLPAAQQEEPNGNRVELPYTAFPATPPQLAGARNHNRLEPRSSEFHDLEPRVSTPARRARLDAEARTRCQYVPAGSAEYWDLRDEIVKLEEDLAMALDEETSEAAVMELESALREARAKDPEYVYQVVGGAAESDVWTSSADQHAKYEVASREAKKMLPQFNLEGLWVGKYGSHGFEMINVTYSGDQLIAYKVTGDANIPRGEISFTADLSLPVADETHPAGTPTLAPIVLSESSADKWGTTRLPRFPGQGHAAEPGFVNHELLEGQLVVIGPGEYFSFAWVPLEHQIFFGRPSPELTLKMLREGGAARLTAGVGLAVPALEAGPKMHSEYISRCFEATGDAFFDELNEGKIDPFSCIWHGNDEEHCYFE